MASGVRELGPGKLGPVESDPRMLESAELLPTSEALSAGLRDSALIDATPRPSAREAEAARNRAAEQQREQRLVARAQTGDERALRVIYDEHERQVRGHLYRLLGSDSEIDDLVQIVFSRAFGAIGRFEGKSSISTWLYRITANTTHNLMRQRFRRDRMKRALRVFDVGRGADRIPASKVEARDEAQRMLERLRPELREIFVLYHYEGLTLQEISKIVGRPISTIGDRLTRARKQLHELVSED